MTAATSERSTCSTTTSMPYCWRNRSARVSSRSSRRATRTREWPCAAYWRANSAPKPLDAPVMRTHELSVIMACTPCSVMNGSLWKPRLILGRGGSGAAGMLSRIPSASQGAERGNGGARHFGLRLRLRIAHLQQVAVSIQHLDQADDAASIDRKSTRLNSSHGYISYAVFCLKKKKKKKNKNKKNIKKYKQINKYT